MVILVTNTRPRLVQQVPLRASKKKLTMNTLPLPVWSSGLRSVHATTFRAEVVGASEVFPAPPTVMMIRHHFRRLAVSKVFHVRRATLRALVLIKKE